MKTRRFEGHLKFGSKKSALVLLALLAVTHAGFADTVATESKNKGFYIALPSYLFADSSSLGLQGGFQFKKANLRFDVNMVNEYEHDLTTRMLMSSVGLFFSRDWQEGIRIYQGTSVGAEFGIKNSFDGQVFYMNYVVGAELLSFGRSTFFLEIGPGISFNPKDGAFNGGTVIGGGIRRFF